ncbi:glycosyltransferase family 2 protein [Phlebopus sp. FC_14]|nr:glycosyltransferase family 2 protein [Phlebopus sp. FC_14]
MSYQQQRPARLSRPHPPVYPDHQQYSQPTSPPPPSPLPSHAYSQRPPSAPLSPRAGHPNISFQNFERGDRQGALDAQRQRSMPSPYQNQLSPSFQDAETGNYMDAGRVGRKKSLVRPDREKIEPGHRQWHYRTHAAQMTDEGTGRVGVQPSSTGNYPQREKLRRGKSLLAREQDVQESGLALFKRGATLRRKRPQSTQSAAPLTTPDSKSRSCLDGIGPGPKDCWFIYCYLLTCCIPPFLFRVCGIRTPEQQRAWREKMGLISIILMEMAAVGFITFGFTETVCGTPPNRFHQGQIGNSSVIIHGYDYDFSNFKHPAVGEFNGSTNPLITGGWNLASNDASFLFQNVNQNCLGIITKASGSSITGSGETLDWYFPCNVYNPQQQGVNLTGYGDSTNCHVSSDARQGLASMKPQGQVYYTWDDVNSPDYNLAVFESTVLDLDLLQWLSTTEVQYPALFDQMKNADGTYNGKDISMLFMRTGERQLGKCLEDIVTVGFIDTSSIGCVASEVVLYLSLVFIIGVVGIRFAMAVLFAWFFSWKLGNFPRETYEQRMQRSAEIEHWSSDIYRPAPSEYRPNVSKNGLRHGKGNKRSTFFPSTSRFTPQENALKGPNPRPTTAYGMLDSPYKRNTTYLMTKPLGKGTPPDSPAYRASRSTMSFGDVSSRGFSSRSFVETPCPFPLHNIVPQPPPDYEPFNFPLAHTICLVTAYSESVEGLRTTIDSLATTDYPNSHKLILVIADGMVKGAGNTLTTPQICLSMMKDFIVPPDEIEPHSYVAIADGHKRHNMAKVYAGFYDYDDSTVERSKQQRVPMVLVAKVGNPLEVSDPKPGNRGKRDSQIVLMAFLQKVMFDERMTTFEYEFFNSIWRVTGVSPDRYELVLCVDADTKVFPDSLTRMVSCMVVDVEIMGLCGETKIANKADNFVTMIQVFEYYISHHMTKAFEAMFGGVTCLPGCFSMYRIKAPKGDTGYWVPVLANPDIVEHYSENVVDTLHKKNLLLLGEDRYLTTLLLKTFPRRKNMFCPQAVCKTIVPDTFRVLLSQRRRWINSTIHNLAELVLVRDLCGTFCFSMQFVVGMELMGTLVLPAAISFTLYLIIISIIPGHTNTTIPLVLLAIVLGLPGLLIVVTSRKIAYVGWMLVYLVSLPIWNGLLPAYAFWHFDDFSWGQTRQVAGDKGGDHGDKEGEFDSSHIVMKRWAEFERDRRWRNGVQSRDSTMFDRSNRYSMASNSDTNHPPSNGGVDSSTTESVPSANGGGRSRHDSSGLLMLPAPLSMNRTLTSGTSSAGLSRSSEDAAYMSEVGSTSNQRLVSTPQEPFVDSYSDTPMVRYPQFDVQVARAAGNNGAVLRNPTVSSQYPGETQNPFRTPEPHVAAYDEQYSGYTAEPEDIPPVVPSHRQARGVSLSDNGPVPGPEGVRRVARPTGRRPTSQAPQNRYSRSSTAFNLPPGAAPPQAGGGSHGGAY